MTNEELTKLEQLAQAATPGPWLYGGYKAPDLTIVWSESTKMDVAWLPEILEQKANGNFIAASRDAVPALIADLRHARAEAAALRQRIAQGPEIITSKIDTVILADCSQCKVKAEAAALRAEVETLRKENEILKAFKKTIARFEREADEKKYGALESEPIQAVSAGRERVQGCTCGTTPCVCPF